MNDTTVKTTLSLPGLLLLAACGGGNNGDPVSPDGGSQTTVKVSGLAIDGYIEGATAFLDLNFNGVMDDGEPTDVTDQNGRFDFDLEDDNVCKNFAPVVIEVPAGAYVYRTKIIGR